MPDWLIAVLAIVASVVTTLVTQRLTRGNLRMQLEAEDRRFLLQVRAEAERQQEARAADRTSAAEQRLFEHRRQAGVELLVALNVLWDATMRGVAERRRSPTVWINEERQIIRPVAERESLAVVTAYESATLYLPDAVTDLAWSALMDATQWETERLRSFANGQTAPDFGDPQFHRFRRAFREALRSTLGPPST